MTDDAYTDHVIADLERKLASARTDDCAMSWARKLVAAKESRGDYQAVGVKLTEDMREMLVIAMVKRK